MSTPCFTIGKLALRSVPPIVILAILCSLLGCSVIQKKKPAAETTRIIAVPEEKTVKSLKAGDMVPFDGYLVGKARFAQLAPCFRDLLTSQTETIEPTPDPRFTTQKPPVDMGLVSPPWSATKATPGD